MTNMDFIQYNRPKIPRNRYNHATGEGGGSTTVIQMGGGTGNVPDYITRYMTDNGNGLKLSGVTRLSEVIVDIDISITGSVTTSALNVTGLSIFEGPINGNDATFGDVAVNSLSVGGGFNVDGDLSVYGSITAGTYIKCNDLVSNTLTIGDYITGAQGAIIDESGAAEFKAVTIRESLEVPEIRYNRAEVFTGVTFNTFGGGIVETVTASNARTGYFTLKLEEGEAPAIEKGDLCCGFWHNIDGENETEDYDGYNANFKMAGFQSVYFAITNVSERQDGRKIFYYALRTGYTVHPYPLMHFAAYANDDGVSGRTSCKITTTEYEVRLKDMVDWTYGASNIYYISGMLDGFKTMLPDLGEKDTGIVLKDVYLYGNIIQYENAPYNLTCKIRAGYSDTLSQGQLTFIDLSLLRGFEQVGVYKAEYSFNGNTWNEVLAINLDGTRYLKVDYSAIDKIHSTVYFRALVDDKIVDTTDIILSKEIEINGRVIRDINSKYLITNHIDKTQLPAIDVDGDGITGWNEEPLITTNDYPYLWTYEIFTYEDDTTDTIGPILQGNKGDKGDKGENGENGKDGTNGKDGENGKDGRQIADNILSGHYDIQRFTLGNYNTDSTLAATNNPLYISDGVYASEPYMTIFNKDIASYIQIMTDIRVETCTFATDANISLMTEDDICISKFNINKNGTFKIKGCAYANKLEAGIQKRCRWQFNGIDSGAITIYPVKVETILGVDTLEKQPDGNLANIVDYGMTPFIPNINDSSFGTNANIVDGTRDGKGWTSSDTTGNFHHFGDNDFQIVSNNNTQLRFLYSPKFKTNGIARISFEAKISGSASLERPTNSGGIRPYNCHLYVVNNNSPIECNVVVFNCNNEWQQFGVEVPYMIWPHLSSEEDKFCQLRIGQYNISATDAALGRTSTLHIRKVKVESGRHVTPWTISENDKQGLSGFTYRPCGTYDDETLYVSNDTVKDVVWFNGNYYVCRKDCQGVTPTSVEYWEMSSKMKFLSVEALFADEVWAKGISGELGAFDNLKANNVDISGKITATEGVFNGTVYASDGEFNGTINANAGSFNSTKKGGWEMEIDGQECIMKFLGPDIVVKYPDNFPDPTLAGKIGAANSASATPYEYITVGAFNLANFGNAIINPNEKFTDTYYARANITMKTPSNTIDVSKINQHYYQVEMDSESGFTCTDTMYGTVSQLNSNGFQSIAVYPLQVPTLPKKQDHIIEGQLVLPNGTLYEDNGVVKIHRL